MRITLNDISSFEGKDKTTIRQIFQPSNTADRIRFSLAHFTLKANRRSALHRLRSAEVYYILEGKGKIHLEEEEYNVKKDDAVFVKPNTAQFIENVGVQDLIFLCVVDPAWQQEDEQIIEEALEGKN